MSFLQKTSGLIGLQRSHISPIARILLSTRRVNYPALQQLRRPFNGSVFYREYFPRNPRNTPPGQVRPQSLRHEFEQQDDYHDWGPPPPPPPRSFNTPNIVVGSIVGTCIGIYGYTAYVSATVAATASSESLGALNILQRHFVHSPKAIKEGRYYTIITSAFMHTNLLHLSFNMVGLWSFGRMFVQLWGVPSFMVLYFGSVVTGGLVQNYVWKKQNRWDAGGVGASGGVFGIFSAMACAMPKSSIRLFFLPMPIWAGAALSVVISVGGLQERWLPGIGHADHLGGMAFGVFWWLVAMRRGRFGYFSGIR